VGVHVLNVGDVDLKAGKFYADFELYLHTELDAKEKPRLYPASAILDPNLHECGSMRRFRPFEPSAEANNPDLPDFGLFFVNVDRWRTISRVLGTNNSLHHYRVQSHFMFRTNVSAWPINTERLEIVLESQPEALSQTEGLFFCTMPEFSGLSDSIRFPGSIDNSRLHFESSLLEHCGPPFLRPTTVRQCAADAAAAAAAADSAAYGAGIYSSSGSSSWFLGGVRHGPPALPPAPPTIFLDRRSPAASSLFDRECACVPVEGFQQGYERESCGCQGGRTTSARVAFTVVYHTPELGVIVSCFLAPIFISVINLATYLMPPVHSETRMSIVQSGIVALVLYHAGLKSQVPLAGVLTLADRVLLVLYGVAGGSFVATSLILTLQFEGRPRAAMLLFRASRLLGPLLSALAFATYANPVCELLLDGTFFSRLTRTGLVASALLLVLLRVLVAAVARAGGAARRRRRRQRGGGLQLVELEGDDDRSRGVDQDELGESASAAEAHTCTGTDSIAATQRAMQRTLRALMDTQQQTAEQLATLTSALASMQQGPKSPTPTPTPTPTPMPMPMPMSTHSGAVGARGGRGAVQQPDYSSTRRHTLPQSPAIPPEQPLIELEADEPLGLGLYGSLSL